MFCRSLVSVSITQSRLLSPYLYRYSLLPHCRSKSKLTVMKGKTVSTRTISFPITAVNAHEGTEEVKTLHSPFQCQLERHMELERQREESNDTKLCLDFLHKLGGITHYISSITLGAMEYSVYEVQVRMATLCLFLQKEINKQTKKQVPLLSSFFSILRR